MTYGPVRLSKARQGFVLQTALRYHQAMKSKKVRRKSVKVGVGAARMKAVIKEVRKRYGPMLKRLAD